MEPTAKPSEYIVYTRIGRGGFDNGVRDVYKRQDQNQMKMYTSIVDAVKKAANLVGIKKIIL